jgi:hypothetical protein
MACLPDPGEKKKYLPFDVGWHGTPTLFIAMNGLDGNAKEFGQLFLRFT